ncbi:hypothetical protein J6590_018149 [Homalodisca vitripennis]|nr:hypothetical protein J6590_018149 [Homalodisca vitripennis]
MNSDEPAVVCLSEDKLGFIMFECGLEGVSIKVVKRSKFDKEEDEIKNVATENETNYTDSVRSKDDIEVSVVNEVNKPSSLKPEEKSATHPETPGNVSASAGETNQPDPSVDPAAR